MMLSSQMETWSSADWGSLASSSDRLTKENTLSVVMTRASVMLPEEVAEPREDSGLRMTSLGQPSLLSF